MLPNYVVKVMKLVKGYVVGGTVRDLLLGLEPKDYDVATPYEPEQVKKILEHAGYKVYDKGIQFGTVAVLLENGIEIEITTFRKEQYRDSRKPMVEFTDSLYEDLSRRDFTINAMAMDVDGNVIDPFNGQVDLCFGVLRFVGCPDERIREDPLRMLRACRFGGRGFLLGIEVIEAIWANRKQLKRISAERVTEEFRKAAGYGAYSFATFVAYLFRTGLAEVIFGDVAGKMMEVKHDSRGSHYGETVYEHTLDVLARVKSDDFVLLMAALFHDFGKVDTVQEVDGKVMFIGHEEVSVEYVDRIMGSSMKGISRKEKRAIKFLVREHMIHSRMGSKKSLVRYFARKRLDGVSYELMEKLLELAEADVGVRYDMAREVLRKVYELEMPDGMKYLHLEPEKRKNAMLSSLINSYWR